MKMIKNLLLQSYQAVLLLIQSSFFSELDENAPDFTDLTNTFSRGARSIVLKENAQKWQVCSQVEYEGAHVILEPGRRYSSLCVMGLVNPVMSMRKSGKSQ